jgi:hypothetical protein
MLNIQTVAASAKRGVLPENGAIVANTASPGGACICQTKAQALEDHAELAEIVPRALVGADDTQGLTGFPQPRQQESSMDQVESSSRQGVAQDIVAHDVDRGPTRSHRQRAMDPPPAPTSRHRRPDPTLIVSWCRNVPESSSSPGHLREAGR